MGMFWVPKPSHAGPFSTLHALMVLGHGKVVKIQPQQILDVLMENEKNCTPKSKGVFRALNRVIRARF